MSERLFRSNRPGYPHLECFELGISGIRAKCQTHGWVIPFYNIIYGMTQLHVWAPLYQSGSWLWQCHCTLAVASALTHWQNCTCACKTLQTQRGQKHSALAVQACFYGISIDIFWKNFTGMFLRWLFTKIAQLVPLHWTRWPPELKGEKPFNDFFSLTSASILK